MPILGILELTVPPPERHIYRRDIAKVVGMGMGIPQNWHRRQALMLASQLPENQRDALLIVEAVRELLNTFLVEPPATTADAAMNVLPFTAG